MESLSQNDIALGPKTISFGPGLFPVAACRYGVARICLRVSLSVPGGKITVRIIVPS
jgi:hypothetical protein